MTIALVIISFILENFLSDIISLNTLFNSLLILMALIIIYPYYKNNQAKYYLICGISGLFYDLVYCDTVILNMMLFVFLGFMISKINLILANNAINNCIVALIIIIIYRLIMFLLLLLTGSITFDLMVLLESIYSSTILNIIYILIIYFITDRLSDKYKIKKTL